MEIITTSRGITVGVWDEKHNQWEDCSFSKKKYSSWSNLSPEEYTTISKAIRDYLRKSPVYNETPLPVEPLRADFIIWSEEKVKSQIKALKNNLKSAATNKKLRERLSKEDTDELKASFEKLISPALPREK